MSIAIVTVVVPASGEGPAASIAALVGKKTVTLTGRFSGSYALLATHNGTNFVPVLVFNSDGLESIKLTLPDAYSAVRVRCGANTAALGAVTMTVAGVSLPGENLFASLATFPAGSSGTTSPVFDLAVLFPPTGVEEGTNIICEGGLGGALLVEGSQDGLAFNPVGTFQGGRSPRPLVGLPAPLEFTPLSTGDQVRYLRFTLQGQASSDVYLTVGGRIPAGSGGVGIPIQLLVSDAGATVFQALGINVAAPLDVLNVVAGYNTVGVCPGVTVLGHGLTVGDGSTDTLAVGSNSAVTGNSCSLIGTGLASTGSDSVLLMGGGSSVGLASPDSVVAGFSCSVGDASPNTVVAGFGCSVGNTSGTVVLIGSGSTVADSCPLSVVVGPNASLAAGSSNNTLVGSILASNGLSCTLLGSSLTNLGASSLLVAGVGNTVGVDSHNTTVLGRGCLVGERCGATVLVTSGLVVPDDCNNTTAVGSGGTLGLGSPYCVLLGTAPIGSSSPVSVCINGVIGNNAHHSCAILGTIGSPAGLRAGENFCYGNTSAILDGSIQCVLLGGGNGLGSVIESACDGSILLGAGCSIRSTSDGSVLAGLNSTIVNSSSTVCVGRSNIVDATGTLSSFALVVGGENNVHADLHDMSRMVVVGNHNDTTGLLQTVIFGSYNTLADGTSSVVVGLGNSITAGAGPDECVLVGKDLTTSADQTLTAGIGSSNAGARSVVAGYQAQVGALAADGVAVGPGATILGGSTDGVAVGHGATIGLNCINATAVGNSSSVLSERGTALGNGATVPVSAQGSSAIGSGAVATVVSEVIFDGSQGGADHGVLLFHALGHLNNGADPFPDLLRFEGQAAANPLDSAMFLFYRNTAGTRVSQQVKVQAVTGLLYVPV